MSAHPVKLSDLLSDSPKNWGKWGVDDEIGALNYLDDDHVRNSLSEVRTGKLVTLQRLIGRPEGDPMYPTRQQSALTSVVDESSWADNGRKAVPGGARYADDKIEMFLQSSTQYDALGHVWYDDQLWNGFEANSTVGGLRKASIEPVAKRGIAGRAVLIDFPRYFGVSALSPGHRITLEDLINAAEYERLEVRPKDILILRTNYLSGFYDDPKAFWDDFEEPGLAYTPELVKWFDEMSIPNLVTDTFSNEALTHVESGAQLVLHNALMRNLGISFTELCDLEKLSEECAHLDKWSFFFTAAPLAIHRAAGSPVNPLVIL